jgi:hypothetical protein
MFVFQISGVSHMKWRDEEVIARFCLCGDRILRALCAASCGRMRAGLWTR